MSALRYAGHDYAMHHADLAILEEAVLAVFSAGRSLVIVDIEAAVGRVVLPLSASSPFAFIYSTDFFERAEREIATAEIETALHGGRLFFNSPDA